MDKWTLGEFRPASLFLVEIFHYNERFISVGLVLIQLNQI
jgi:hypothetical protein